MTTLARPQTSESSHWYTRDGQPCHTVKCTTKDGERPTTIADARKLGLLPSVTNILRCLHKEALVQWRCEQAVLACLTSPRNDGEPLDDFVQRILHTEKVQDQEAKAAADLGTRIHRALEDELSGRIAEHEMLPWIEPVWEWLNKTGCDKINTELVLVGEGYAGRTDLIQSFPIAEWIWDFKTTKKLPTKGAYLEHKLQRAAYAKATGFVGPILTGNIYISTVEPGKFVVDQDKDHTAWHKYYEAFEHILKYWQIANQFP